MVSTTSRDAILSAVRRANVAGPPLPDVSAAAGGWVVYSDPMSQFGDILKAVGGRAVHVRTVAEAQRDLEAQPVYTGARQIASLVPGVGVSTVDLAAISDPHDLRGVDFAILPGRLAVAENAAVWVTDDHVQHRVLYFLTQHLALVVPSSQVVNNMHEAYQRIAVGVTPFAAWISGPSKTADIEQSLVIGAHGARSMTVYLVDELTG